MFTPLFNSVPLGIRYILLSAIGFALMSSLVKLVGTYGIPVFEIVAVRSIVSVIISYADVRRKGVSLWGNNKKLLFARGSAGSLALICVYYSVTTLPLAEATILQYTHPVFTALLAFSVLGERVKRSTMICIALCIVGLGFIVGPSMFQNASASLPLFSVVIALLGAAGSSVAYILVRRLTHTEDSSVIIFYFPLIALPLSLLLLGDDFVMPSLHVLMLMIFVGVFTQIGQIGITKAMQTQEATVASAYSYVQVIFSVALGWLMFNEVPIIWTWLGGGLIILGALVNVLGGIKKDANSLKTRSND